MMGAMAASRRRSGAVSGPVELVSNGAGNSAGGWADYVGNGVGSVSSVAGRLRVVSSNGGAPARVGQTVSTVPGTSYRFRATMIPHFSNGAGGCAVVGLGGDAFDFPGNGGSIDVTYVATGTTTLVSLWAQNYSGFVPAGEFAEFDDISLIAA